MPSQSPEQTFPVSSSHAGMRLDAFVSAIQQNVSRSRAADLARQGAVRVNGTPRKPSFAVRDGDLVTVDLPAPEPVPLAPEDLPLFILYEDSDLVVVNKPPGMVVHPAPGRFSGTLVNALLFHVKDLGGIGGELRPGIVHRLDKDTSGALVAAKNDRALASLSAQFAARSVEKIYWAICFGIPEKRSGVITLAIGRNTRDRKKMQANPEGRSRDAVTEYELAEAFRDAALLSLRIRTGRTHQIRVHLSALGHPVVGDTAYAGRRRAGKLPASVAGKAPLPERQMLHAARLGFTHPRTGERLSFSAPLFPDMENLLTTLHQSV
ncbi:MAG: RluA family pseudouridine synthase [Thermodesulfobacteriota bacterium]